MVICLFCDAVFAQADSAYVSHMLQGHPIESTLATVGVALVPRLAKGSVPVSLTLYALLAVWAMMLVQPRRS